MELKDCGDCEYYIQHYAKYKGRLIKVSGHCINTFANGRMRKTDKACEEWILKKIDEERAKNKTSAICILEKMYEKLSDLVLLLKD